MPEEHHVMGTSGTVVGVVRSNVSRETDDTAAAPWASKERRAIGNQEQWMDARAASRTGDWMVGLQDGSI